MSNGSTQNDTRPRTSIPADVFPKRIAQLSTTWLTSALRAGRAITQARVVAFRTAAVPYPGFASECARIHLQYDQDEVGAPATVFAKFGAYRADALRNFSTAFHAEVRFYQQVAPELGDLVPRSFFAAVHPDGLHFALLLEDLAPSRLMLLELDRSRMAANVAASLRGLAAIHARFWNRHQRGGDLKGLECPYSRRDDSGWLLPIRAQLLQRHGATVPKLLLEVLDLFIAEHRSIYRTCARQALTLSHSDYHPTQVFLPSEEGGRFCVVDWFDARYAEPASNVQRMLLITLRSEERRALEDRLLHGYVDGLRQNGVLDHDFDTLLDRYRASMIDSVVVQLGFAAVGDLDRVDRQLAHLDVDWREICFTRIVAACEDHDVLGVLRRDARLGKQLQPA